MFFLLPFQVIAITVGVLSVAVGIGIPVFYETQIDNAVECFYLLFIILLSYVNVFLDSY